MKASIASSIVIMILLATVEVGMAQDVRIAQDKEVRPMRRVSIDGLELEYETRGRGEPVVLVCTPGSSPTGSSLLWRNPPSPAATAW